MCILSLEILVNKEVTLMDKLEPFEKLPYLLEKLILQSACSGDKCPQFNQIKVKQNLFITIILTFIMILIGVSTWVHVETDNLEAYVHATEITSISKQVDLSRHVQGLDTEIKDLDSCIKDHSSQLNCLNVEVEKIKLKVE